MVQLNFNTGFLYIYLILILYSTCAQGFVLLHSSKPILPISETAPYVEFALTTDTPSFKDKHNFLDGKYANLDDNAFFKALVEEAMNTWNNVKGSYLQFVISNTKTADKNSDDFINSINIGSTDLSSSAFAKPIIQDNIIVDCDITVSKKISSTQHLAYTLMHELGHCLGLGHNHTNKDAVMGYFRTDYTLRLGADDIAGLVYLYPNSEYNQSKPKELISCGSIGIEKRTNKSIIYIILILPILIIIILNKIISIKNLHPHNQDKTT